MNEVILVDTNDVAIGSMEKMEAHEKALLHRAFSVFTFNSKGEMLLQKKKKKNITARVCGRMHAVVIHPRVKILPMLQHEG